MQFNRVYRALAEHQVSDTWDLRDLLRELHRWVGKEGRGFWSFFRFTCLSLPISAVGPVEPKGLAVPQTAGEATRAEPRHRLSRRQRCTAGNVRPVAVLRLEFPTTHDSPLTTESLATEVLP